MPLVIISGPSAVGKDHFISIAVEIIAARMITPFTTRPRRQGEVGGREYDFVSRDEFRLRIREHYFYDWDYTLGNYYGCSHNSVDLAINSSRVFIMHALARMAIRIAARAPDTRLVFLKPNDPNMLRARLEARGYSSEELDAREGHWQEEMEHIGLFDYVIEGAESLSASEITRVIEGVAQDR